MRTSLQTQLDIARIGIALWFAAIRRFGPTLPTVVVIAAVLAFATAASAQASPSKHVPAQVRLTGETSEGGPVVITVAGNGRKVLRAVAAIDMTCGQEPNTFQQGFTDRWDTMRVSRAGAFHDQIAGNDVTPEGDQVEVSGSVTGRVNRKLTTVTGVWKVDWTFHSPDGTTMTCTSGPLKFRATR